MENRLPNGAVVFLIFACIFVGAFVSHQITSAVIREAATKRGLAEYVIVDPLSGRTEWRWKTCECCKPPTEEKK